MENLVGSRVSSLSWPTVLCIDDDPQIGETIGLRLRNYAVKVLSAHHGMQGFWQATRARPDLIITDMRMPQGSGDYLVERLRRNGDTRSVPVIVLTGRRDPELEGMMRQLGAQEFFTKPAPFGELLKAIAKYIPLAERADEDDAAPWNG